MSIIGRNGNTEELVGSLKNSRHAIKQELNELYRSLDVCRQGSKHMKIAIAKLEATRQLLRKNGVDYSSWRGNSGAEYSFSASLTKLINEAKYGLYLHDDCARHNEWMIADLKKRAA